jgi:hypothetical protein
MIGTTTNFQQEIEGIIVTGSNVLEISSKIQELFYTLSSSLAMEQGSPKAFLAGWAAYGDHLKILVQDPDISKRIEIILKSFIKESDSALAINKLFSTVTLNSRNNVFEHRGKGFIGGWNAHAESLLVMLSNRNKS